VHKTDEKCIQNFSQKTSREETTWETLGVGGRILLKYIKGREHVEN
jgi:hypothetical protein